jgi:hypothetical protein
MFHVKHFRVLFVGKSITHFGGTISLLRRQSGMCLRLAALGCGPAINLNEERPCCHLNEREGSRAVPRALKTSRRAGARVFTRAPAHQPHRCDGPQTYSLFQI